MGKTARLSMTRRNFVQAAAVTGFAATIAGTTGLSPALAATNTGSNSTDAGVQRIRTVCRACGKMECGVWVTVQDGVATRVEGDQSAFTSRGNCCTKSQSSIQACYHPDRIRYPMKRTGAKKEDPAWERITWDEALETSAQKFKELIEKYGGNSLFSMNGTSRMWAMGGYAALAIILGTVNHHVASEICKGPRFFTTAVTDYYASNWMAVCENPRVFVDWGSNIEYSNYDDSCRVIVDVARKADTYICIDPRLKGIGKEADYWLHIKPATDQAIALAWAKIIWDNGLTDELYMKRWSNAAYLVVEDMAPSGGRMLDNKAGHDIKTRLLKECDVVEGGSINKWYVHDATKAAAGATGNAALSYYDTVVAQWEGEHQTEAEVMKHGRVVNEGTPWEGFLPDATKFDSIDPDLIWEGNIVLKDGTTHKARTVWSYIVDNFSDKTPEWAEEVTGVEAATIRDACLAWATRPEGQDYGNGGIHLSLAPDQTGNPFQAIRSIMMLAHMTGNYDIPAGDRGPTKSKYIDSIWIPWFPSSDYFKPEGKPSTFQSNELMLGGDDFPLTKWYGQWADAAAIWTAALEEKPYPIVGGANDSGSFMNMTNSGRGWEAMNKLDFWMEVNLWHHPTAECADILLPCYHWLEMRFPRISQSCHCGLAMNYRCVEPPGDCKSDPVIMIEFYRAMGTIPWDLSDPTHHVTEDDNLEHFYAQSGELRDIYPTYKDFEAGFQKNGWENAKVVYPKVMGTYRRYETGYGCLQGNVGTADPANTGLPQVEGCDPGLAFGYVTPTRKYEVWPTVMESMAMGGSWNVDESWLVPFYRENKQSASNDPELNKEYPLWATTGRRIPTYFHSEHRQLPWCREQWPVPRMEINPDDAAELGLEQGDWAWIETKWGKIREVVDLYYGIQKGVINLEHAWWFPELSAPNHGEELCNCNRLLEPENQDPIIASSCMRGFATKVYKATAENSPFGNPVPCDPVDGTPIITSASDPRLKEWLPDYTLNGSDY